MFNQHMGLFAFHLHSDFLHPDHGVIILVIVFLRFKIFAVRVLRRSNAEKVIVARVCLEAEFLIREIMEIDKVIAQGSIHLQLAL